LYNDGLIKCVYCSHHVLTNKV